MLNITQNSTTKWYFALANSIANATYQLTATNKCNGSTKTFNAVNLQDDDCDFLEFSITEVGAGGTENLEVAQIRLNPSGGWTVDVYELEPDAVEQDKNWVDGQPNSGVNNAKDTGSNKFWVNGQPEPEVFDVASPVTTLLGSDTLNVISNT